MEESTVKNKKSIIYFIIITLIFIVAIILRIEVYLHIRPFWHDEAPVALTVMNNGFMSIMNNIIENQKAPIGFWYIIKLFGQMGSYNELSLRFFPFICSCLSIFAFYLFSKEVLHNKTSIIFANVLFSINLRLIYYAQELKQYSVDVLFICLSLLFFSHISKQATDIKKVILCLLYCIIMGLFSFPSIFVAGGFLIYKLFSLKKEEIKYYIILTSLIALFLILYYFNFYAHSYSIEITDLKDYWESGFLTYGNYINTFKSLYLYLFSPNKTFFFGSIMIIIGLYSLIKEKREINYLILLTIILVLIASVLSIYPLYERVALYLTPIIIVCFGKTIEILSIKKFGIIIIFSMLILTFPNYLQKQYYYSFFKKDIFNSFDGRSTLNYIKQGYNAGDKILINGFSLNTYIYYAKKLDFENNEHSVFDFRKGTQEEFNNMMSKLDRNKTYWIYCVFYGKENNEKEWLMEWEEKNPERVKEKFIQRKSYVLKI